MIGEETTYWFEGCAVFREVVHILIELDHLISGRKIAVGDCDSGLAGLD